LLADLANLVNEAALLAARSRREAVAQADFAEAIERVVAGLEEKPRPQRQREKIVAYHEVGHAIVGYSMGVVRSRRFLLCTRDGSQGTPYNCRLKTASNG